MMRKPSVLFINRVYVPAKGATGRLLSDLAQGFVADGWDVTVITSGPAASQQIEKGVLVKRIKGKTRQSIFNYALIWTRLFMSAFLSRKTDLIVTMTDPPFLVIAGRLLAKAKKSYHIHWCQDLYPDLLPILGVTLPKYFLNILRQAANYFTRSSSRIVAIGLCMGAKLARTGIDPRRILVIPNWADLELSSESDEEQFHTTQMPPPALKNGKKLLINKDPKFRVLYAGSIGRAHPMQTILEAAAILQISNPEIEFIFVGEGPGFDALAEERSRRSLENVRLLPRQPESHLQDMMQSGDIHLISMKQDTLGLLVPSKIYSAFASGRPCIFIGPDQCEAALALKDYGAGTTLRQGDPKGLAEEIIAYRIDGSKWFEAHKGAMAANEEFSSQKMIAKWINCARSTIRYPAS